MFAKIIVSSPKYIDEMDWNNYTCDNYDVHSFHESETTDAIRHVAYSIVAPIILIFGILGNILNLIVLRKPFLKQCTRLFLIGLASSDLSVMITAIPMMLRLNKYHGNSFETAYYYAYIEIFLSNVFITASVLIVVCLTVERYFSVCHPTIFKNIHTRRIARISIIWCYVFAILISFPLTLLKRICILKENNTSCVFWEFEENRNITTSIYWTAYLWFSEFVIRLGPCTILFVLNILILRKFRKMAENRRLLCAALTQSEVKSMKNRKLQLEKKMGVLLRSIVILFFITMTPSSILSLVYSESYESKYGFQAFRAAANNLELANFALNFYAYFLCSRDFRVALAKVFQKCTFTQDEISDLDGDIVNTN